MKRKFFERDFLEFPVRSKCFQSLRIKSTISLYILLLLAVGKPNFSSNLVEETRPGCQVYKGY